MHAPLAPEKRLLLRAADLLREDGFCKGVLHDDEGHHCVVGAIHREGGRDINMIETAIDLLALQLSDITGPGGRAVDRVVWWNNRPERTAEEVIGALELVALS